ncbi:MAG: NAD(P)-dependent alcohol dehydrogenase [Anaerolineales bacterium]|jgi:NADPH:quinone reductase-like Zn-dependent oxidoreductase
MKAIIQTSYGEPSDVLELREIGKPAHAGNEVLIKVRSASITFGDQAAVKGEPVIARLSLGLREPKIKTPGKDVAGVVEAVGANVKQFKPGDEVFGDLSECGWGAYAEYVSVPESALVQKPANITFEAAASVPESAVVALQGLQDKGAIQSGQKVLIYGASGGIGTFAVQIAKSFEAEVTGVCSTRNLEMVHSLGADHVIDYTQEDFTQNGQQYDLILATAGYRSIFDYKRALAPGGHYVATGGEMAQIFQPMLLGPFVSSGGRQMTNLAMKPDKEDLTYVKELIEAGKVTPVIDKSYPLSELSEALRYYGEGRSRGKVVVTMD